MPRREEIAEQVAKKLGFTIHGYAVWCATDLAWIPKTVWGALIDAEVRLAERDQPIVTVDCGPVFSESRVSLSVEEYNKLVQCCTGDGKVGHHKDCVWKELADTKVKFSDSNERVKELREALLYLADHSRFRDHSFADWCNGCNPSIVKELKKEKRGVISERARAVLSEEGNP